MATVGALAGTGVATLGVAASTAAAVTFARHVVTPARHKPDDLEILQVGPHRVVFSRTPDSVVPGRYGVWTDGGRGHFRVGEVLEDVAPDDGKGVRPRAEGRVTRELLGVDAGVPRPGPARWNQYYWAGDPGRALGLPHVELLVPGEVGPLPVWDVPPAGRPDDADEADGAGGADWAVLVHGRGATREETLRALPLLHRLGLHCAVPAYRNDADGPPSPARRYGLGGTEWHDVHSVVQHALDRGARRVVLVGWSMGGAIALQFVARSPLAAHVAALVLDGPVVDWRDVLDHQARKNGFPVGLGRYGMALLGHPWGRRLVGVDSPVDLSQMDWVRRAEELSLPVLLVHSAADDYVPAGPSRRLAEARPDLITYVAEDRARHTKEWNVDPRRWEDEVEGFLTARLGRG